MMASDALEARGRRTRLIVAILAACCAVPATAAQLDLEAVLGASGTEGFERAEAVRAFDFPADHGPHERFRSEWWYVTVNARNAQGAEFGVQFTVFRQATTPHAVDPDPWSPAQIYLAHLAVTDVSAGRHSAYERLARGHPRLAGARADPFAVWVDGWSLRSASADFAPLRLDARTDDVRVELVMAPVKPIVLQGDRGLSVKGPGQASYYYTIPRLAVDGVIEIGDDRHVVQGTGWFDREWSTSLLSTGQVGWDWFGLQFDSGEELMAFRLRRADGSRDPADHGAWIAADGNLRALGSADFELLPRRFWRDPAGVRWPVEWELRLRTAAADDDWRGERRLRVVAALDDQRMHTLVRYWEGLAWVQDEQGRRIGAGYMELTGYE